MRRITYAVMSAGLVAALVPGAALGAPAQQQLPATMMQPGAVDGSDNLPSPMAEEQQARRQEALESVLNGKAAPQGDNKVVKVAPGQFVELARVDEDSIWTVLGEFGDAESPFEILQGGLAGPQHNEIPEPDRSVDNTTIWTEDFSEPYYEDLLFSEEPGAVSMRNFYLENSSGQYTVNGDVTDWAQVPFRAAHYGRDYCNSIVCPQTWRFVEDSVDAWYQDQLDAGMTPEEIDEYLSQFDEWDRYDHDGDGDFDEPDGYIDHFQSVHAGAGQETGGGEYGEDAIWSHRWYVQTTPIGSGGPTLDDGTAVPFGGTQVGGSDYWIGDYTIEPENGGVGVFAHEFAHDLGLPDLYDTAGNTCPDDQPGCAENSTAFWTLMSSGSYGGDGTDDIGSKPMHMGIWEKFQLGWLQNYDVAVAGERSQHKLGPSAYNTKAAQALFVLLPDKQVLEEIGEPASGEQFYYSGNGNDLDNRMYRSYDLPAGASLTAQVDYDIESDWDYAYLVASTDGGATWEEVETSESTSDDPNGQNFGHGITGDSDGWTTLTADLSAYTGEVLLGFRYWTDVAVTDPGISIDDIEVTGNPAAGAEDGDPEFIYDPADGFRTTNGSEDASYFNAYVVANRQYLGYDDSLRTGPYNFVDSGSDTIGNLVEHFSYQDGMLVNYWDESQSDNSTSAHPGEGLILPVDAHPELMELPEEFGFSPWRARVQSYDSTFGLEPTPGLDLHWFGVPDSEPGLPANPLFDDSQSYWTPGSPASVNVPDTGTQIRVRSVSRTGMMQVQVNP